MFKKKIARACQNHKDTPAVSYCRDCKVFFCQACETGHNSVLGAVHKTVPAESVSDFDLHGGKCSEHSSYPLDSFCTNCFGNQSTLIPHNPTYSLFSF